ncbi:OmpA family protein, partial [Alphaproteobacteria bacterium]|nr:OmpA family protein [Alphaproteobacteria bacterium]
LKDEFSSPLKDETDIKKIENRIDEMLEEKVVKKLELKNKIQFKIATINFNSGSSSLNRNGYKKIMKVLKLANERDAIVKIVGHASTRTKDMDILKHKMVNFVISDKRAQAVASVFVKNKFPLDKLITEAVSDSKPLFHEVMPAGTNANQRTEIYLIY